MRVASWTAPSSASASRAASKVLIAKPASVSRCATPSQQITKGPGRAQLVAKAGAVDQASTVRIQVQGRHVEVTPSIHEYAMKKVAASIEPFKAGIRSVEIRLSVRGGDAGKGEKQQKVELTARTMQHGVIRAEVVKDDLYAAIDVTADKVARSLRKLKEKAIARGNWGGRGGLKGGEHLSDAAPSLASVDYDVLPSDEEVEKAKSPLDLPESVKRTKVFYLDAMSLSDAIDKLQYVDHDFYIYLDEDSGHVQVVYKRKSEGYGVIITVADEAD